MQKCATLRFSRLLRSSNFGQCRTIGSQNVEAAKAALAAKIETGLGDDGHRTPFRIDIDKKTIATAAGDLPVSPLMDPAWMEATQRYKTGKIKPQKGAVLGRFRKKLFMNPWAHALATNWRHCPLTAASMPRYFLQDFRVVSHPETGFPWWAPGELSDEVSRLESVEEKDEGWESFPADNVDDASSEEPATTGSSKDQATENPTAETKVDIPANAQNMKALGNNSSQELQSSDKPSYITSGDTSHSSQKAVQGAPVAYALARKSLIQALRGHHGASTKLGTHRTLIIRRSRYQNNEFLGKLVWRTDMDEIVLDLMRRRIVKTLLYFAKLKENDGRAYLTPCADWEMIKDLNHRGCVLWCVPGSSGQRSIDEGNPVDAPSSSLEQGHLGDGGPRQFAIWDIPDAKYEGKLPVHNLHWLLGEEQLQILRSLPLFKDNSLLVVRKQRTIPLQLALWKLQGYLAEYE